MRRLAPILVLMIAFAALGGCGADDGEAGGGGAQPPDTDGFDAERAFDDLRAQVEIGPRPAGSAANRETAQWIAGRLRDAGVGGVRVQHPWRNVVGTLPGELAGSVVVGAHFDTKDAIAGFVGANDGASGVAVVLELARSLPRPLPGPSVQVVLFDAEEARGERPFAADGTRGSRQYVGLAADGGGQGTPPLDEIRAMVLFDMVGDCDLKIPLEANSDAALHGLFAEAAGARGAATPFEGTAAAVSDDHVPFLEAGVPAVDLIDFDFGPGPSPGGYWHTPEDTIDKVCPESLDAVGEAALRALPRIR